MTNIPEGFTCAYCGHVIKREVNFLKHECKEMVRHAQVRSVVGKRAYGLYSYWLSRKKQGNHNLATFSKSKFFSSFYKFAKWSTKVNIPDKQLYIRFNILKNYPPNMWTDNMVYVQFIEWIDMKWTAADHFRYTYNTLKQISNAAECDITDALNQLHPNQILVYVTARKLSPWVLLWMKSFKTLFANLSTEQRLRFQQAIRPMHWTKIIQDPALAEDNYLIKEAVRRAKI